MPHIKIDTMYNLESAGKATGKAKNTIRAAIVNGRLSAKQTPTGRWEIDPAELHRVYPPIKKTRKRGGTAQSEALEITAVLEVLKEERQREREQYESTVHDLRHRLDRESEERIKLTQLLTHQTPTRRPTLFERIFGG